MKGIVSPLAVLPFSLFSRDFRIERGEKLLDSHCKPLLLSLSDCHYAVIILSLRLAYEWLSLPNVHSLVIHQCSAVAYASSISLSSHTNRVAASPLIYLYTVFFTDCVVPQLQRHHQPLYVISAFFLSSKIQMTLLYIDSIDYPLTRGNPYILSGTPPIAGASSVL